MAHLILALGQYVDGMPPEAVEDTKRATIATLDGILPAAGACHQDEKKEDYRESRPQQVHLIVAGPKRMVGDARGIDKPDWEKQWTYGEVLFGEIVRSIGLQRFSPSGGTQLMANLLDVGVSGGESQAEQEEATLRDIAKRCLSTLRLKLCPQVVRTTIVLPMNATEAATQSRQEDVKERVKGMLSQIWNEQEGPLRGTEFDFVVVGA